MLKEPKNPVYESIILFKVRHVKISNCSAFRKRNRLAFGERQTNSLEPIYQRGIQGTVFAINGPTLGWVADDGELTSDIEPYLSARMSGSAQERRPPIKTGKRRISLARHLGLTPQVRENQKPQRGRCRLRHLNAQLLDCFLGLIEFLNCECSFRCGRLYL